MSPPDAALIVLFILTIIVVFYILIDIGSRLWKHSDADPQFNSDAEDILDEMEEE